MFEADQAERQDHPAFDSPAYWDMRRHDAERRLRVSELLAVGEVTTANDYFHAALIFQHGEDLDDIWRAHELARQATELGPGRSMDYKESLWLAAAALDRWLMYQGKPQKYGTQFVPDGKRYRLWDLDPATTDEERTANHVPSLQEQLRQAERLTEEDPPSRIDMAKAPPWLREALLRWERDDSQ
jgi:hypothetical protein